MKKNLLAAYLSMTPPTLSRMFAQLQELGIATVTGKEVRILDPDLLRTLLIK